MKRALRRHQHGRQSAPYRNVGTVERWLSLGAGAGAVAAALRRRRAGGAALGAVGAYLLFRGASGHCPGYARLRLSTARANERGLFGTSEVRVHSKIVLEQPQETVYRYWRQLDQLPRFMSHVESVRTDGNRSRWVARAPLGRRLRWESEITQDSPNERLAWRSLAGSDVDHRGELRFRPSAEGTGTELDVELFYRLPGGRLGRWLGGISERWVRRDIEDFKRVIERQEPAGVLDQGLGRATVTPARG